MLKRTADICYRHRWRVLIAWIVLLVSLNVVGRDRLRFQPDVPPPEHGLAEASDLLDRNFPARAGETASVVFKGNPSLDDPAVRAQIDQTLNQLRQVPRVIAVRSPFDQGNGHQVSATKPIAYAEIQFGGKTGDHLPDSVRNQVEDIVSAADSPNVQAEALPVTSSRANRPARSRSASSPRSSS